MTSKTYAGLTVASDILDDDLLATYRGSDGPLKSVTASLVRAYVQATPGSVPMLTKSANYTVLAADIGSQINCSGTFTLSLTAAATLGAGFSFGIKNTGTGVITIDPNGSELIDGRSTICVYPNEGFTVLCSSTAFNSVGRNSRVRLQPLYTVGVAAASVEFTQGWNDAEFTEFTVDYWAGSASSSNVLLSIGDATYGTAHAYTITLMSSTGVGQGQVLAASSGAGIAISSAGATNVWAGHLIITPYTGSNTVAVQLSARWPVQTNTLVGSGDAALSAAMQRTKFTCGSGNIAAGATFDIWGQR